MIGRISHHDHDRLLSLDLTRFFGFLGQMMGKHIVDMVVSLFQRVGEIDTQTIVTRPSCLGECQSYLQMSHRITRHQYLKSSQTRQEIGTDIARPDTVLSGKVVCMDIVDGFVEKCACPCRRIEDLHTMDGFLDLLALLGEVMLDLTGISESSR